MGAIQIWNCLIQDFARIPQKVCSGLDALFMLKCCLLNHHNLVATLA